MKPLLLVLTTLPDDALAFIGRHFDLVYAPDPARRAEAVRARGAAIRAVLTIGPVGLTAAEMDAMPSLSIACALGVGYENIDVAHARARGVVVANGAGTNDDCVADHAFALLLSVVRGIPAFDQAVRAGQWRDDLPLRPSFSHKRLGILGMGSIGAKLARRGLAFDLAIGYHNRRPREGVAHAYFDSPRALADWADYLVVATPGGAATHHLVNAAVLKALGPRGVLVNIARGSVVDTQALADALRHGHIAGAGLDVYESEPQPPTALFGLAHLVITPHVAGVSPESRQASLQRFIDNATRHFAGQAPVSPV